MPRPIGVILADKSRNRIDPNDLYKTTAISNALLIENHGLLVARHPTTTS